MFTSLHEFSSLLAAFCDTTGGVACFFGRPLFLRPPIVLSLQSVSGPTIGKLPFCPTKEEVIGTAEAEMGFASSMLPTILSYKNTICNLLHNLPFRAPPRRFPINDSIPATETLERWSAERMGKRARERKREEGKSSEKVWYAFVACLICKCFLALKLDHFNYPNLEMS
ncbi:hypothetical protein DsansV1_C04g0039961 [Dioscorea sansibarensis]